MGISETFLGRKNLNGNPFIDAIQPAASLPGGEIKITGRSLKPPQLARPEVSFAGVRGTIVVSAEEFVIARVPYGAQSGPVMVHSNGHSSNTRDIKIARLIADNVHPVANPAFDAQGNLYATFSGSRGQKVPVSIYKIDNRENARPFVSDVMNATGLAFDSAGQLYVSSRYDGTVYRVAPNGTVSSYAGGMGVATGIAFDREGNLYVGDRTGTIWRIAPDRQIFVFATLEPSLAAYHLAFAPDGNLYVTGPTTSSFDAVYSVDPHGSVSVFYRGLGRPQGLAFDAQGNLYVAASLAGQRGIVKITPEGRATLAVSGHNLVGLAFARNGDAVLATVTPNQTGAVYHLGLGVQPLPLI
jgi:sugar lactone lactonase YvrE